MQTRGFLVAKVGNLETGKCNFQHFLGIKFSAVYGNFGAHGSKYFEFYNPCFFSSILS